MGVWAYMVQNIDATQRIYARQMRDKNPALLFRYNLSQNPDGFGSVACTLDVIP